MSLGLEGHTIWYGLDISHVTSLWCWFSGGRGRVASLHIRCGGHLGRVYGIHYLIYWGDTLCRSGGNNVDYEEDTQEYDQLQEEANDGRNPRGTTFSRAIQGSFVSLTLAPLDGVLNVPGLYPVLVPGDHLLGCLSHLVTMDGPAWCWSQR